MFEAILLIGAIVLFVMDALNSNIFPRVSKTPLGLALMALAILLISGTVHRLGV